jgi:sec-independent protein translocase protein TatA
VNRILSHLEVIPGLAGDQTLYPSGMPGWIGLPELLILLVVVLIFFGPKRLPEMGRSLGRGMREFKESVTGNDRDDEPAALPTTSVTQDAPVTPAPQREHDHTT